MMRVLYFVFTIYFTILCISWPVVCGAALTLLKTRTSSRSC